MIYLFCNNGYGRAYQHVAAKVAVTDRTHITFVFSSSKRRSGWRSYIRRSFQRVKDHTAIARCYGVTALRYLKVLYADDINSDRFRGRIEPGAHGVIAGFNQIFRQDCIKQFASLVNFHPSILPFYRGPVPAYWCLVNAEEQSGYTLHEVTARIDEGEILYQEIVSISGLADPDDIDQRIAAAGASKFEDYLQFLRNGHAFPRTKVEDPELVYKEHVGYRSLPAKAL